MKNSRTLNFKKFTALALVICTLFMMLISVNAAALSVVFDEPLSGDPTEIIREDISKRDRFTKHFLTGDGSYFAVSYAEPVHYEKNGTWKEVDSNFSYNLLTGKYSASSGDFKVQFNKKLGERSFVTVKDDGLKVSWGLTFSEDGSSFQKMQNSVKGNTRKSQKPTSQTTENVQQLGKATSVFTYENVYGDYIDLRYTIIHGSVKEDIILKEYSDLVSYKVSYDISNATAVLNDDGSIDFYGKKGDHLFTVSVPFMYDSAGEVSYDIDVSLTQSKKQIDVTYTPSSDWLSDENRVYPVVIDPETSSSTASSNIQSAYFNELDFYYSDISDNNPVNYVANNHYNTSPIFVGEGKNIAYIKVLNVPAIPSYASVIGADFVIFANVDDIYGGGVDKTVIATKVKESWNSSIGHYEIHDPDGFTGNYNDLPLLGGDEYAYSTSFNNFQNNYAGTYRKIIFNLNISNSTDYNTYFSSSSYHGFKLDAGYLDLQINSSDTYIEFLPAIVVRYKSTVTTSGLTNGGTYVLKNANSNKYLTIPGRTAYENIYQDVKGVNDEYSRTIKLTYDTTRAAYKLSSHISNYQQIGDKYVVYPIEGSEYLSDNIYLGDITTTSDHYWVIVNNPNGTYTIIPQNRFTKALSAVGTSSGTESGESLTSAGNIILSDYNGSANASQQWYFESTTVNVHIIKNEVTKKNLGLGAEWVFQLSSSEMSNANLNVSSWSLSRSGLVTVQQNGKSFIVKMNLDTTTPDDHYDDYVILTINLSNGTTRHVVIQNAGTTASNTACATKPFYSYTEKHIVYIDDNSPKDIILTFKSDLGNVVIEECEIQDDYVTEFAMIGNKLLIGTNFAIIKVKDAGFSIVTAKKSDGTTYTMIVEVRVMIAGSTIQYYRGYNVIEQKNYVTQAKGYNGDTCLISLPSASSDPSATSWSLLDQNSATILFTGDNFAVLQFTPDYPRVLVIVELDNNSTIHFVIDIVYGDKAIIILPGVMGSCIYADEDIHIPAGFLTNIFPNTIDEGTKLWDPDSSFWQGLTLNEKILSLAMDENGEPIFATRINDPIINNPYASEYGALDTYRYLYQSLYNSYYQDGYEIVLFEYDWRYDPYDTALLLNDFINWRGYSEVIFVAHSMGGIVSSYYISLGETQRAKVDKNISIGTPYLGSIDLISIYLDGEFIEVGPDPIVGVYNAIKSVIYNFPSVYALLPFEQEFTDYISYKDSNEVYITLDTYNNMMAALETYMPNWNSTLADAAIANRSNLFLENGEHITTLVDSYYIVGTDISTVHHLLLKMDKGKYALDVELTTSNGDGTVTLHSSTINETLPYEKVYYKIHNDTFIGSHTGMVSTSEGGKVDTTTIEFIIVLIDEDVSYDEMMELYGIYQNNE